MIFGLQKMKAIFLLASTSLTLGACSSINPYRNEEFEKSQRITVEFSNSHIAQRHIDQFARLLFEKKDLEEAIDYARDYSKKSGQYKIWQASLEQFAQWLSKVTEPGNYKYDEGFNPRTSLVAWLLEKHKGEVCCKADKNPWQANEILLEEPSREQIKRYNSWATEPLKIKQYFMTPEKERIWPNLTLKMNAKGE